MADISNNSWTELDDGNTSPSPDGMAPGTEASKLYPIIRGQMGAIKRAYNQINAIYTSTGTGVAYALTFSVAPEALKKGVIYSFFAHASNTGAATLNVNFLGAKPIVQNDGTALKAGQITANSAVMVVYDGSSFRLQSYANNPVFSGTVTADAVTTPTLNATTVTGNGAALTDLNASNITTGTIADARLPGTMVGKTFTTDVAVNQTLYVGTENGGGIELGRTNGVAADAFLDFHTSATAVDYNVRLQASGNGAAGAGTLNILAGVLQRNGKDIWDKTNLPSPALQATQISAGSGLSGGGSLSTNRTISMGAPSSISGTSTNSVSGTTHSHQLVLTANDISGALGYLPGKGDGVPIGGMIMLYGNDSTAPNGYLLANGAAVTSTYPDLRAFGLARGWAVNGNGDPLLPDMGGYFPRGWRTGQTVDSARVFGTIQQDAFQNHRHPANRVTNATISVPVNNNQYGPTPYIVDGYSNVSWGSANGHGADLPDGTNGTPRTSNETRPTNVTVTYWVKAFSADQTTGTADLTQLANDLTALTVRTNALEGKFASAAQTVIGSGVVTVGHTLGKVPSWITLDFVNTQAEGGYSIGDIVNVAPSLPDNYGGHGITVSKTTTNVIVIFSSGGVYLNQKTGGAPYLMNPTRWQLIVRAAV